MNLPADDADLETSYIAQDYLDVATDNDVYVDQTGTSQYMIHQFKDFTSNVSARLTAIVKSTLAPSSSTVYLQIYNRNTTTWDTVDSDNATVADTEFTLTADVLDLTDYKDAQQIISCRVYQAAT